MYLSGECDEVRPDLNIAEPCVGEQVGRFGGGNRRRYTVAKIYRIEIQWDWVASADMRTNQSCGHKRVDRDAFDIAEAGEACSAEFFQRHLFGERGLPRGGSFWASAASSHSGTRNTSSAFTLGSAPGY